MKPRLSLFLACAIALSCFAAPAGAASPAPAPAPAKPMPPPGPGPGAGPMQPDKVIDAAQRADLIDKLAVALEGHYVFPDKAKAMVADVRAREKRGEYAGITSAQAFARKLTEDLRGITHDKHLSLQYSAQPLPPQAMLDSEEPTPQDLEMERRLNVGIERVQRLDFNLGYLDLRAFVAPARSKDKLAAAMTLLADTDALVVDLRSNGGGDPATVALLESYLFDQRTHLNDIYERSKDRTTEYWTSSDLAGKKFGGKKKVFILVSNQTFSGGEDFAYSMQAQKRATLIGATTGGGAHPVTAQRLSDNFAAMVPFGRAINPITKTNWEGVGVVPDIAIDPDKALEKAQALYLSDLVTVEKDPMRRQFMEKKLAELQKL